MGCACGQASQVLPQPFLINIDINQLRTHYQLLQQAKLRFNIIESHQKLSIKIKDPKNQLIPIKDENDYKLLLANMKNTKIKLQYDQPNQQVVITCQFIAYKNKIFKKSPIAQICKENQLIKLPTLDDYKTLKQFKLWIKNMFAIHKQLELIIQEGSKSHSLTSEQQFEQLYGKQTVKIKIVQLQEQLIQENPQQKIGLNQIKINKKVDKQYLQANIINQKGHQLIMNLLQFNSLKKIRQKIVEEFKYQPSVDFQIVCQTQNMLTKVLDSQQSYQAFLQDLKQINQNQKIILKVSQLNMYTILKNLNHKALFRKNNVDLQSIITCKNHKKKKILPKEVYICAFCNGYYLCEVCHQSQSLRHDHPFFKASIGSLTLLDCNESFTNKYKQYKKQIRIGSYFDCFNVQDKQIYKSELQKDICFRTVKEDSHQRQLFFLYNFQTGNKYAKQLDHFNRFDSFPNYVAITNFEESKSIQIRAIYKTILNAKDDLLGLVDYLVYQQKLKKNTDEQSYYVQRAMKIFKQKNIIRYYTQEQQVKPSFYKIINKTLKMALDDPFLLAYLRYPLKMLSTNIKNIYQKRMKSDDQISQMYKRQFKVNRKIWIEQHQFNDLQANVGQYIQMLGFLSTSLSDKYKPLQQQNTYIQIIKKKGNKNCLSAGFAMLVAQKLTKFTYQQEVLFNIQSIFKIIKTQRVNQNGETKYYIFLEYVELPIYIGIIQKLQYQKLYPQYNNVLECLQNHSLQAQKIQNQGDCFKVLNLFKEADKFYLQQFRIIDLNTTNFKLQKASKLFLSMGILQKYKNDIFNASFFFQKSLAIQNFLQQQSKIKPLVSLYIGSLIRNSQTQVDLAMIPAQLQTMKFKQIFKFLKHQNMQFKNKLMNSQQNIGFNKEFIKNLKYHIQYLQAYQQNIKVIHKQFQKPFSQFFYQNYLNKQPSQRVKIILLTLFNKSYQLIFSQMFQGVRILTKVELEYLNKNLEFYFTSIKFFETSLTQYENIINSMKYILIIQNKLNKNKNINNKQISQRIVLLKHNIVQNFGCQSLIYSKFIQLKIILLMQTKQYNKALIICQQNIQRKQKILGKMHLQLSKQYHNMSVIFFRMFDLQKSYEYLQISLKIAKLSSHQRYLKHLQIQSFQLEYFLKLKNKNLGQLKQKPSQLIIKYSKQQNKDYLSGNDRNLLFYNLNLQKLENMYNQQAKDSLQYFIQRAEDMKQSLDQQIQIASGFAPSLNKNLICNYDDVEISTKYLYGCIVCDYFICEQCYLTKKQKHMHRLLKIQLSNSLLIRQYIYFIYFSVFSRMTNFSISQLHLKNQQFQIGSSDIISLFFLKRKENLLSQNYFLDDHIYYKKYLQQQKQNKKVNILKKNQFSQFINISLDHQVQQQRTFQFLQSYLKSKDQGLAILDYLLSEKYSNKVLDILKSQQQILNLMTNLQSFKEKNICQLIQQNKNMYIMIQNTLNNKKNKLYSQKRFPLQLFYNKIKQQYQKQISLQDEDTTKNLYIRPFQIYSSFNISQTIIQNLKYAVGQYIRTISFLQLNSKLNNQINVPNATIKLLKKQSNKQFRFDLNGFAVLQTQKKQEVLKPIRVIFNPGNIFKVKKYEKHILNSQQHFYFQLQYFQFSIKKAHNLNLSQYEFQSDQNKIIQIYQYKSLFYQNQPNYFNSLSKSQQSKQIFYLQYVQMSQLIANQNFINSLNLYEIGKSLSQFAYDYQKNGEKLMLLKALQNCDLDKSTKLSSRDKILVHLGSLFLHNRQIPIVQIDLKNIDIKQNIMDLIQYLEQNERIKFQHFQTSSDYQNNLSQNELQQLSNILKNTFVIILNKILKQIDKVAQIQVSFDQYFIYGVIKDIPKIASDYKIYTYLTELVHRHLYCMNFTLVNFYTKKELNQFMQYLLEFKRKNIQIDSIQAVQCSWLCYRALNLIYLKLKKFKQAFSICKQAQQKIMKFYGQNQLIKAKIKQLYIQYYLYLNKPEKAFELWQQIQSVILQKYFGKNIYQIAKLYNLLGIIYLHCQNYQEAIENIDFSLTELQYTNFENRKDLLKVAYLCRQTAFVNCQKEQDSIKFTIDNKFLQYISKIKEQQEEKINNRSELLFRGYNFNVNYYHFKNKDNKDVEVWNQKMHKRRQKYKPKQKQRMIQERQRRAY